MEIDQVTVIAFENLFIEGTKLKARVGESVFDRNGTFETEADARETVAEYFPISGAIGPAALIIDGQIKPAVIERWDINRGVWIDYVMENYLRGGQR